MVLVPPPDSCAKHVLGHGPKNDPVLLKALDDYHREKLTNNTVIPKHLKADHNVIVLSCFDLNL